MPVSVGFRFVTGAYHATAWDQAVNSGLSEWPPAPWRVLRAILSTWHTRHPELPADRVEHLLTALSAQPPRYWLPPSRASHTRHYLPSAAHRSDEVGGTSLTLAPRLHLSEQDLLVIQWPDLELDPEDAAVLGTLMASIPYLGRAESVCAGELLTAEAVAQRAAGGWTAPTDEGGQLRVLVPQPEVTRAQLEVSPDAMRKAKRLTPVGARWVGYQRPQDDEVDMPQVSRQVSTPHAVRWLLDSRAPFREQDAILATTGLRGAVLGVLGGTDKLAADTRGWLMGGPHNDAPPGDHQHAHWWWVANRGAITELMLWVPGGIPVDWVGRIASVTHLPEFQDAPKGYRPGAALHLQGVGELEATYPAALGTSRRWRTVTPMLTERFPKKRDDAEVRARFVRKEIQRELDYRGHWWPEPPVISAITVLANWEHRDIVAFRRYRWKETMASRRRGFRVEVEFEQPVTGPVSLGALSHFGFGLFEAVP